MPTPLFLAGRDVETDDILEVRAPYDDRVVARVCQADADHLDQAIAAVHEARETLAALPAHARASILERARSLIEARQEELAATVRDEAGKPITFARGEVGRALDTLTDGAFAARALSGSMEPLEALPPGEDRVGWIQRVPVGPVAAITPFNFPFNLVMHKLAPAIAAGCPVVLKPASPTPSSALQIARILREAGLPDGALSVLPMETEHADALTSDRRLRFLSFTGSAKVGWMLKGQAAHMGCALELGGNAANVVFEDADLDHAVARIAAGAFGYAGQSCISAQRTLVHEDVFDTFLHKLLAHVAETVVAGDPKDEDTVVGPLIRASDVTRVLEWIDEARQAGATVHTGGTADGPVVAPTVLTGAPTSCRVEAEEVFGPVLSLRSFATEDEAFAAVNDSRYGLQAGVFTDSVQRVMRAHDVLDVGAVVHDEVSAWRVDSMPYGGVKDSGLGREGPRHAVYELTEPRMLVLRTRR